MDTDNAPDCISHKGVGLLRADFGLKFQVHLTKDFRHFLNT